MLEWRISNNESAKEERAEKREGFTFQGTN